jgi:hypothetical protein
MTGIEQIEADYRAVVGDTRDVLKQVFDLQKTVAALRVRLQETQQAFTAHYDAFAKFNELLSKEERSQLRTPGLGLKAEELGELEVLLEASHTHINQFPLEEHCVDLDLKPERQLELRLFALYRAFPLDDPKE